MDDGKSHSIGLLGYDEKTESWFIETRDPGRLGLDRGTIGRIVGMYNSVHSGRPLRLIEERSLSRLEDDNRRLARTIRDLYLAIDRERQARLHNILLRLGRAIGRVIGGGIIRTFCSLRRRGDASRS